MTVARIALAARNNAEWCDAVTRSWGGRGRFEDALWINPGEAPPFYPNAVTLMPTRSMPATILEAQNDFAVKDSFSTLDLGPLGFAPLFEASWIWRDPQPVRAQAPAAWSIVRDAPTLARWEEAWRAGEPALDLFRPALLDARDHAFIAGEIGGDIVAGCVASRSAEVVGISNLFGTAALQAGCITAAQDVAPGLPLVGYEADAALEAMKSQDFKHWDRFGCGCAKPVKAGIRALIPSFGACG